MRKWDPRWAGGAALFVLFACACRRATEPGKPETGAGQDWAAVSGLADIDQESVAAATGLRFRILKTEAIGQIPFHKFYWIAVGEGEPEARARDLADAIVRAAIAAHPRTYHSITIHFYRERELRKSLKESPPFARATFLPAGGWAQVGRASIEDYAGYVLDFAARDGR